MNPKYPIYLPTKGRHESRLTGKYLDKINVPHYYIVEESDYDNYCSVVDSSRVLILPQSYLDEYETCDDLGNAKSKGPGSARNFAWDHSKAYGFDYHWVMDDNIKAFYRFNDNKLIKVSDGTIFKCMEDFVERYTNVTMAGPAYYRFAKNKLPNSKQPPFIHNTRIYSCNLIKNNSPYRWRGRYNEDTILSLDMLKDGNCTVQFLAFIQQKSDTNQVKGGNTDAFYAHEGTLPKSQMLVDVYPE